MPEENDLNPSNSINDYNVQQQDYVRHPQTSSTTTASAAAAAESNTENLHHHTKEESAEEWNKVLERLLSNNRKVKNSC